jgi:Domain of unknown function (DU1801)
MTPDDYIAAAPEDRAEMLRRLRAVILAHLPQGYVETINWGMISYEIPLSIEPKTYNGKPLMLAGLANQKNGVGLHLCSLYVLPEAMKPLVERLPAGRKLDMGKACIRLKTLDAIHLPVVGEIIAAVPVERFAAALRR